MSFLSSRSDPGSSSQKITVSKRELEQLVEQEVRSAIKEKESNLDALLENIQQKLNQGMSYEASIKILQRRMMAVTHGAEQALALIRQTPTSSQVSTSIARVPLETGSTKVVSQSKVEVSTVKEFMEKTKKQFEHLHAENAALKAAFDDIRERTTPSPTTSVVRQPKGVFEGLAKLLHIKKEPVDDQEAQYSQVAASGSAKRTKEEPHSPEENRNPKRIKFEPEEVPYPPLPELPFPSMLSLEAVNYNVPPRLKVDLALIKNPSPQLSVVWTLDEDDSNAPPMDSYSIYHTTELATGSSMFDEWQKIRDVEAMALPMFYPHIKYRPGYKICVSVVGKDKFGRYGPFSKVACAFL